MVTNRSTSYALAAAGYIAKHHKDEGLVLSQTISKEYNIPLEYLFKLLEQLVRANILRSKRGPRGGFSMARSAGKITMLEIIEAIDGPMVNKLDLKEIAPREKFSGRAEKVCEKAIAQAREVFARTTLASLGVSKKGGGGKRSKRPKRK